MTHLLGLVNRFRYLSTIEDMVELVLTEVRYRVEFVENSCVAGIPLTDEMDGNRPPTGSDKAFDLSDIVASS